MPNERRKVIPQLLPDGEVDKQRHWSLFRSTAAVSWKKQE